MGSQNPDPENVRNPWRIVIEDDLRGPLISATVSERCHSVLGPLTQGLAFLSSLQAIREARARQEQKEIKMLHMSQLQGLLLAVNDFWLSGRADAGMGANRFGLQKVVLATGRGKLYRLDSTLAAVLWQEVEVEGRPSALHLQRDGRMDSEAALAGLAGAWPS